MKCSGRLSFNLTPLASFRDAGHSPCGINNDGIERAVYLAVRKAQSQRSRLVYVCADRPSLGGSDCKGSASYRTIGGKDFADYPARAH